MTNINSTSAEERVEALWRQYLPDVPPPEKPWLPWLRIDCPTFICGLEILVEKRSDNRFEPDATTEDYAKYLSKILKNIAVFPVTVTEPMGYRFSEDDRKRFSNFVRVAEWEHGPDGSLCYLWTGAPRFSDRYGRFSLNQRKEYAHVVAFFLQGDYLPQEGELQDYFEVHHLCGQARCVNAAHLRLVRKSLHRGLRNDPLEIPVEDFVNYDEISRQMIPPETVEA